jgi:hypothetical protein
MISFYYTRGYLLEIKFIPQIAGLTKIKNKFTNK